MSEKVRTQHPGLFAHDLSAQSPNSAAPTVVMPRLFTQTQLAEYLGKSEAWAERAVERGRAALCKAWKARPV